MSVFKVISGGLRALVHRQQNERELDEELRAYVEDAAEQKVRSGMTRENAWRQARAEMGSLEGVKENVREVGWEAVLQSFVQDVRYGMRMLRKNAGFTCIAVLALSLGIGANTAMFSVVDAVLLRPLPYSNASELISVASTRELGGVTTPYSSSPPDFFDWRDQSRSFTSMFAYYVGENALTGRGEAKRVHTVMATAEMFATLQVRPVFGRGFLKEENHEGANHVVVLSHALWQAEFGGAADALGKRIELDGEPYTIIGVMPSRFQFPLTGSDAYLPIGFDEKVMSQRGAHYLHVLARLRNGVSVTQANEDLGAIMAELRRLYPDKDEKWSVHGQRWSSALVGEIRPALLVLLGAVACVMLIACANVSNLLLARAAVRRRELAMRKALGAGRLRLVRQMLTEGLLLALLAGGASLLVAHWALQLIIAFAPKDIPRIEDVGLNGAVMAFTLSVSIVSALLFGMIPALRSSGPETSGLVKSAAWSTREAGRARNTLLIGEVALSMMLLAGAGLLIRSFVGLRSLDPGFDPNGVLTLSVGVPDAHYKTSDALQSYWDVVAAQLRGLPGVTSVGLINELPMSGDDFSSSFVIEGRTVAEKDQPSSELRAATPDYFRTLAIPLKKGRMFTDADRLGGARVVLVSETAAKMFFPAGDAIGQRLRFGARGGHEENKGEIVGVVGDVHHFGVDAPVPPIFYVPLAQAGLNGASVVIRTAGSPAVLGLPARKLIQSIDRDALVSEAAPLQTLVSSALGQRQFYMIVLGAFAALALMLAAVGLYGVISYSVTQRTQEIGIRVALGAARKDVLAMVLRQGLGVAVVGLAVGLLIAMMLNRTLKGLLVGVSTTDPLTLVVTAAVLLLVAVLACYVPARRAMRVDPMVALRFE